MADSGAGGGESPSSPGSPSGSTPGGGIGLDEVDDWTPEGLAAEGDDGGGAGSGEPSRGGGPTDSNAAFASPEEDDGESPEEKEYANAVKRLGLEGKSPEQIQRALAKAYWAANNSGAQTARQLREEAAQLYAEVQELRSGGGRGSGNGNGNGNGIDPADSPDSNARPQHQPQAPRQDAPAEVTRVQERVTQLEGVRTETATRMQSIASAANRTLDAVNRARFRYEDAPEDFKEQRRAEFRLAAQEHNSLVSQYESLNSRVTDYDQRLADLNDRLADAQARAQERQQSQEQQARELRRWQSGQTHQFSSLVEQQIEDLGIPEEDRADFFEDVKARAYYTLKQMGPSAPSVDLEQMIQNIVSRKVALARHHVATPESRAAFAREGEQKLRTGRVLRPGGQQSPSAAPRSGRAPGQRPPSWEEQAAAVKRRAAKILGE